MTTTALPLSAGLIIISSLSCISLRADLSASVKLSVLGTCTSTLCLISDLIRLLTNSSLVFLLRFGIQLLFLTNLGISMIYYCAISNYYSKLISMISLMDQEVQLTSGGVTYI